MPSINETHKLLLRQPYYGELTDPANGHCVIDDIEELETEWPEEVNDYCDDQEYWKDYQLRNNPAQVVHHLDFGLRVTGPKTRSAHIRCTLFIRHRTKADQFVADDAAPGWLSIAQLRQRFACLNSSLRREGIQPASLILYPLPLLGWNL